MQPWLRTTILLLASVVEISISVAFALILYRRIRTFGYDGARHAAMPLREQYLLFALVLLIEIAGIAQSLITNSLPSLTTILIIAMAAVPMAIGYTLWVLRWRRRQRHPIVHPLWYSLLGFITTMFLGLVINNFIQYASKPYGKMLWVEQYSSLSSQASAACGWHDG